MNKRASFILLIALLHLAFSFTVSLNLLQASYGVTLIHGPLSQPYFSTLARFLCSPLWYPFWNVLPGPLQGLAFLANSVLWGVMAERLVFGRKTVWRKKRGANL